MLLRKEFPVKRAFSNKAIYCKMPGYFEQISKLVS